MSRNMLTAYVILICTIMSVSCYVYRNYLIIANIINVLPIGSRKIVVPAQKSARSLIFSDLIASYYFQAILISDFYQIGLFRSIDMLARSTRRHFYSKKCQINSSLLCLVFLK